MTDEQKTTLIASKLLGWTQAGGNWYESEERVKTSRPISGATSISTEPRKYVFYITDALVEEGVDVELDFTDDPKCWLQYYSVGTGKWKDRMSMGGDSAEDALIEATVRYLTMKEEEE